MTEREMEGRMRDWLSTRDPGTLPDHLRLATAEVPLQVRPGLTLQWPNVGRPVMVLVVIVLLAALTAAIALVLTGPRLAAENGLVAFVASDGDLYLAADDGSELRRLTTTSAVEAAPVWSPDGAAVAFLRTAREGPSGAPCLTTCGAVVVYDLASGSESVFPLTGISTPVTVAWSPDGRYLSYCGGLGRLIDQCEHPGVIELQTGSLQGLGEVPGTLTWSPDGRWLLFLSGSMELLPLDSAAGIRSDAAIRISPPGAGIPLEASWSPDGLRIAFTSSSTGEVDPAQIEVIGVDGSGSAVLAEHAFGPVWSPDGRAIAFERVAGSTAPFEFELWVMAADGTNERLVATTTSGLRWSPDGGQLYFQEAGSLYAVRPDGTGLRRMLVASSVIPAVDEENDMLNADWQAVLP